MQTLVECMIMAVNNTYHCSSLCETSDHEEHVTSYLRAKSGNLHRLGMKRTEIRVKIIGREQKYEESLKKII